MITMLILIPLAGAFAVSLARRSDVRDRREQLLVHHQLGLRRRPLREAELTPGYARA